MPTQTEAQRQQALQDAGVSPTSLPASMPNASAPVDVSTLGSTVPFTLPPAPAVQGYDLNNLPPIATLVNPAPSATEIQNDALSKKALEDTAKLGTKSAAQIQAEQNAGVPEFQKQLTDINGQIQSLQKEAAAIPLQVQNDFAGRGATSAGVDPIQNEQLRRNSIKALGLSAIAQTLQGNLALAQSQASKAVELEFGPVQAELDYITKALQLNEGKLTREEAKRKDALTIQLQERQRQLDQNKEDKKIIYGWAAEAAKNGATTLMVNQALAAPSPQQALGILSGYMSDPVAKQQALADLQLTRAQINKTNKDAEVASTSTGVDAANLIAYAQQYAATGTIPTGLPKGTFGAVAELAKSMPKLDGAIIDTNTGTKPAISDAKLDGLAAMHDILQKAQQLKELDTKRNHGLVSGIVSAVVKPRGQENYLALRQEIVDLLARARTGAALTVAEQNFYESQLPGMISNPLGVFGANSQNKIQNFANKIEATLDTKLKAQQAAIVGFSKVNIGGQNYTVGQTVTNANGQVGRVNADGSITIIQ